MPSQKAAQRETMIQIRELTRVYRVPERAPGLGSSIRSLFKPAYKDVHVVTEINFSVTQGEMVGLIGPNGAGKATTLKMLSGLLYPTSGEANVAGFTPWLLVLTLAFTVGALLVATWLFRRGLEKYSNASS